MSRRFFELAVRARRLVARSPGAPSAPRRRLTARRDVGGELTQFSFRLALIIDLAYVGVGALGGAAIGRATGPAVSRSEPGCEAGRLPEARPDAPNGATADSASARDLGREARSHVHPTSSR